MRISKPRVIELFAGAGLFGSAFQREGFRLIDAIEIDPVAAATYAHNLGSHVRVGDVRKLQPKGRCELLIAGPPCQGFSTLNSRRFGDPRNELSFQVLRWAEVVRPKVVIIENVAAFLDSPVWPELRRQFARMGFDATEHVLNAVDYGVPQERRRSFIVASRIGPGFLPPRPQRNRTTVRDAWEGLSPTPTGKNHHYAPRPSDIALRRMRVIPAGGDKRDVLRRAPHLAPPSWKSTTDSVTDAWGRMVWDEPSNTLRTALQNASKGRYIHPEQHRVMSLREAARLHSIPDSFEFVGLPTQVARQIGNSVPSGLGRAIARRVRDML